MENVPPSPSPPPRLRRSPKRRALHERSQSDANEAPTSPLGRSIRAVLPDDDANNWVADDSKFYATSPFPISAIQRLPPPSAQGRSRGQAPTVRNTPARPRPGGHVSLPSNTPDASSSPSWPAVAAGPASRGRRPLGQYDAHTPHTPSPPARRRFLTSDSSSLPSTPAAAAAAASPDASSLYFSSSPPWIVITPADSLDVDRRAMDARDEDGDPIPRPPAPLFRSSSPPEETDTRRRIDASSSPPDTRPAWPAAASAAASGLFQTPLPGARASLGAIASVAASQRSFENTPMTSSTAGSADTVRRQPDFAGDVPPGHFSLYPPTPVRPRIRTPTGRRGRAASDPPPRLSTTDISPASSGSPGSPVSPMSPTSPDEAEFEARARAIYIDPSRTASDTALHLQSGEFPIPVLQIAAAAAAADPSTTRHSAPSSLFNRIAAQASQLDNAVPRQRFLEARQGSARVVSVLSTIQSEATEEREDRSSGHTPSVHARESGESADGGADLWGLPDQFPTTPRTPRSTGAFPFPPVGEAEEALPHMTPEATTRAARRASTSMFDKDLPPLPESMTPERTASRTSSRRHSSPDLPPPGPVDPELPPPGPVHPVPAPPPRAFDPSSLLTRKRDSGNSFRRFRESLPAWARTYYANENRHRATIGAQPSPVLDRSDSRRRTLATPRRHETRPESLRLSRERELELLEEYRAQQRAYRAARTITAPPPRSRFSRPPPPVAPELGIDVPAEQGDTRPRRRPTPPFPIPQPSVETLRGPQPPTEELVDEEASEREDLGVHEPTSSQPAPSAPFESVTALDPDPELLSAAVAAASGPRRPVSDVSVYSQPAVEPIAELEDTQVDQSRERPMSGPRRSLRRVSDRPLSDRPPRRKPAPLDARARAADQGKNDPDEIAPVASPLASHPPLSPRPLPAAVRPPSAVDDHDTYPASPPMPSPALVPRPRARHPVDHDFAPHLWHDRRSTMLRRRTYIEPSINESVEGYGPTRRNLQVWLFALGFLMPLAWVVAAVLPLPPPPEDVPFDGPQRVRDLEKQLGPVDTARFENARWWRNINRCMVPVAVLIIVAIIVLVVVASRNGM